MGNKWHGCTYFKCESCGKIRPIEDITKGKVAFTSYNSQSAHELRYTFDWVLLCKSCAAPSKKEEAENGN